MNLKKSLYGLFFTLVLLSPNSGAYSPYSTKELDELEKEFVQQINQSNSVLRDPLAKQYINHLGKLLAQASAQPLPDFFIVKSKEINAFAGPGGHIGINTQLILASENESELAAVMAHEMAHVRLHHLYRMIQHQKQMRIPLLASMLASAALGVINPALGSGALMASLSGYAQDNINFTRSNEKEADRIGIDMLIKSGLNPKGMAAFFKKMQQHSRYYYTDNIPAILRTHPLDQDRIAEAENRCASLTKTTFLESPDYNLFKEFVRVSASSDEKKLLDFYRSQCRKENHQDACAYGHALTLMATNQNQAAQTTLEQLVKNNQNSLFFKTALAEAKMRLHRFEEGLNILFELYENYPDNYAALTGYAQGLMTAGHAKKAVSILLKGSRRYKHDLPICHMLANAQAQANRKGYAYYTLAQCELLQGHAKQAIRRLKTAKQFTQNDHLLKPMIEAKIEEIQFLAKT